MGYVDGFLFLLAIMKYEHLQSYYFDFLYHQKLVKHISY